MASILILGAGIYQVPLIKRAKSRGLHVTVASIPGDYPGIGLADEYVPYDTTDVEAIVHLALSKRFDAVATTGTDVALVTLGAVCDKLGLAGPSERAALLATDKAKMKSAFAEAGVRTAPFKVVRTIEEATQAAEAIVGPVMIKCVDKSGSRGVTRVLDPDGVESALSSALSISNADYAVVEQCIEGHEVGVDGYVDENGEIAFLSPHDKVTWNNGSTNVPVGHLINADFCAQMQKNDYELQMERAVKALGLRSCFFNADVMLLDNLAWVIEVGARVGGTCIPEVIGGYFGFDYYEQIINAALGVAPTFNNDPENGAVEGRLLFTTEPMRVVALPAKSEKGVDVSIDCEVGSLTSAFVTGNNRCGQVVVSGANAEEVRCTVERVCSTVIDECFAPIN